MFQQVGNVQTSGHSNEEAEDFKEEIYTIQTKPQDDVLNVFLNHLSGHRLPEADNNSNINFENADNSQIDENSFNKHNKDVLCYLSSVMPNKFSDKTSDIKFSQAHNKMALNRGSKKLLVNPIFDQTWFDSNHCVNRSDKTKIWKPKTEFTKVGNLSAAESWVHK